MRSRSCRVDLAFGQLVARHNAVAFLHLQAAAVGDRIGFHRAVVAGDDHFALLLVLAQGDRAGDLGQHGLALRLARLEQLFNARKTLRDILFGSNAAGMEGTHRQLRARFADGLARATMPTASPMFT